MQYFPTGTDSKLAMQVDLESMIALSNSVVGDMEEGVHSHHLLTSSPSISIKPVTCPNLLGGKRRAAEPDLKATPRPKKKHKAADRVQSRMHNSSLSSTLPIENSPPSCAKCKEYEVQLRNLEAKLEVCQSDLEDACLAKAAKFSIIQDLRTQLREAKCELERKTMLLEKTVEESLRLMVSAKECPRQEMPVLPGSCCW